MLERMEMIHNLNGLGKWSLPIFSSARTPSASNAIFFTSPHASPQSLVPQSDAEGCGTFKSSQIGGGWEIAQGLALLVEAVLGEDAAEGCHAGFGGAIGGLAFAANEFFAPHGQAGVVGSDLEDAGVTGFGQAFSALSGGGGGS